MVLERCAADATPLVEGGSDGVACVTGEAFVGPADAVVVAFFDDREMGQIQSWPHEVREPFRREA